MGELQLKFFGEGVGAVGFTTALENLSPIESYRAAQKLHAIWEALLGLVKFWFRLLVWQRGFPPSPLES